MILAKSPEYWAYTASLTEIEIELRKLPTWTDEVAEYLDFVYRARTVWVIKNGHLGDIHAFASHLECVVHDSQREALNGLRRPYFDRWRTLLDVVNKGPWVAS